MRAQKLPGWRPQDSSLPPKKENIHTRRSICPQELMNEADRCAELPHESAQEEKDQYLCMSTREVYEKVAVTIDAGASEIVASVEKFESYPIEKTTASGTTYSSVAGKQAEDNVNVGQRYIRVVDDHGLESWAKSQMCLDLVKTRYWEASAGLWNLDTRWCSDTKARELQTKQLPWQQDIRAAAKRVLLDLRVKKEHWRKCTTTSVRVSEAKHVANEKPARSSTRISPIGHGA